MDPIALLEEMTSLYGPPGEERAVAEAVAAYASRLGYSPEIDPKGNVLIRVGEATPRVAVTAHMDEIGMIVRDVREDGTLAVNRLGGLYPWKMGEGTVAILADEGPIPGAFGFGGIHTEDPAATSVQARDKAVDWRHGSVFTGLSREDLRRAGVRNGTRVVIGRERRGIQRIGDHVAGHFLDDRADLVSMLLTLEALRGQEVSALFVASVSEEVGGQGALYALQPIRPDVCIALELGADVPDAKVALSPDPTVWTTDGYASTQADDLRLIARMGHELGMEPQFQTYSRGGSDASLAAHHGLCARPITLGLAMANSHGYEIMHSEAMTELARLTVALLRAL